MTTNDYYEIDFLAVETKKSGDAIAMRYRTNGVTRIHVVDGGFQSTGLSLAEHITTHYDNPSFIDHVVLTHHDSDHAVGLRHILETFDVGALWMLRPWDYAEELLPRFSTYNSAETLRARLKRDFPNIVALDDIATEKKIPVYAPFQGSVIGAFTVMTPTKTRYLKLIEESEKTPDVITQASNAVTEAFSTAISKVVNLIRSLWGEETFPPEPTSTENEMSVVQYALLADQKILLTGDTGRDGLTEAADYAPYVGLTLPGIDRFQVPHHGSRRNVNTELLDRWLGPRLAQAPPAGSEKFSAFISSALADLDHPRKSVIRAVIHRGGSVFATEGNTVCASKGVIRPGWSTIVPNSYPDEQED